MVPQNIERLNDMGIVRIECGAQFSLALTKFGQVLTWGKGDYFRLGHNVDQHVRRPTVVEALRGKIITSVAVGALHCLAVTKKGEVFAWGDNDHGQQGNGTTVVNRKPTLVKGLSSCHITHVACGSSHSIAWTQNEATIGQGPSIVTFSNPTDVLGAQSLGFGPSEVESRFPKKNSPVDSGALGSSERPSLSRIILSLDSVTQQQMAVSHILNALQIMTAREAIVAALKSSNAVIPQSLEYLDHLSLENENEEFLVLDKKYIFSDHQGYYILDTVLGREGEFIKI